MTDAERYKHGSEAFWKVAHMLANERERIEQEKSSSTGESGE